MCQRINKNNEKIKHKNIESEQKQNKTLVAVVNNKN